MVVKNLLRRKIRTLLTILGIGIGVAVIISLGAMAEGLQAGYGAMLAGSQADLVLSQPNSFDISYSSVDESIGADLAAMPEVSAISGMLQGWSQTEGEPFFFVFGYPEDSFVLDRFQIIDGVGLGSQVGREMRGKPVLLGSISAERLNKSPGDIIHLTNSAFRVIGIYETGDAFEDSAAVLPLEDAQELIGKSRQVSVFYLQLRDPALRERFISRAERKWPDYIISGVEEFAREQSMTDILRGYVWAIGGLAIVIGGVGMMNAQLMAVFERIREIGVLRAVGWSGARVLWMILGETLVVSLAGGVLGVLIGWLLLYTISQNALVLGLANTTITTSLLTQAFTVVIVLGLVGGLYPAWRASRLQPVEALRYEGGTSGSKVRRLPVGGMAIQSLFQRSLRTLLTVGTIGLTVGAIMALEGTIRGMAQSMQGLVAGVEIMVRQADISDTELSVLDERIGAKIEALPVIHSVSGIIFTAVILPEANSFFIVFGYEPNEYAILRYKIVEGEPLTGNRQIILGRSMAESLRKGVGSTIELSGMRYRVVGIYETNIGWEGMGGVMTLRDSQILAGRPHKVSMYAIKVKNPESASQVVEWINQEFPEASAALSGDFVEQMPDFETADSLMGGISLLAIAVGGVGVLNTMLMAVFERTREIGVLRALGWRRRAILRMILVEAMWLVVIGGVLGVGIAFGLVALIQIEPTIGSMLQPLWELDVFGRAIITALLLGMLGGLYPAYRATRLQPIEALRYE
jgi:ABC-type antimicrobial peptide transport system permease subunit